MNIFEIQEDLQALIDTLEANGGEIDDELLNQLDDEYCQYMYGVSCYLKQLLILHI